MVVFVRPVPTTIADGCKVHLIIDGSFGRIVSYVSPKTAGVMKLNCLLVKTFNQFKVDFLKEQPKIIEF